MTSTMIETVEACPASMAQPLFPVICWLPAYRRVWLLPDVMGGLAVWAVMVPEGMRRLLVVFPAGTLGGDVAFGAGLEGHALGRIELCLGPRGAPLIDRVLAVEAHPTPVFDRQLARLLQRHKRERAKPHLAGAAVKHVAQYP
jgi:hypothetical protein